MNNILSERIVEAQTEQIRQECINGHLLKMVELLQELSGMYKGVNLINLEKKLIAEVEQYATNFSNLTRALTEKIDVLVSAEIELITKKDKSH